MEGCKWCAGEGNRGEKRWGGEKGEERGGGFLGVTSVANVERRGGLWFGSKKWGGVRLLQIDYREGEQSLLWLP